jgi:predicted phosphate transport protein (TIGR00153 family)
MFAGLLPKKNEFFTLFAKHAAVALKGTQQLQALLNDLSDVETQAKTIKATESEADEIAHATIEMLHRSFITPIERADIYTLVGRIDDIVDYVEAASERIWLYEITVATSEVKDMARVLVAAAVEVVKCVDALSRMKDPEPILQACIAIKQLENECDNLLRIATARLFKEEQDPLMVIKWKEIYEKVEDATDRCEDVANVIEGVLLENG